ncbi:MAG: type IV pilus modification PilV family protein [Gaiellaceae bacterium]
MSLLGRLRVARHRDERGFGMIELVAAMSVMLIGVLAVFTMFQAGIVSVRQAGYATTAAVIADSEMEQLRAIKYEAIGLANTTVDAADSVYKGDVAYTEGGSATTSLATAISASDTSLTIADPSPFPSTAPFDVKIENEIVRVTAGAGTSTWTVTRAASGTVAASHGAGISVSIVQRIDVPACGSSPCTDLVPTSLVTGADGRAYRVDTYATWGEVLNDSGAAGRSVKLITIVVRDQSAPYKVWARVASTFDLSTGS